MFDRLLEFLKDLPGAGFRASSENIEQDNLQLAVAALLFHVMKADGETRQIERDKLTSALTQYFGLKDDEVKKLIKAAEAADAEAIDLANFSAVLRRKLDHKARIEFVTLMWELVYADGEVREIEADIMWRVAGLIGLSESDLNEIEAHVGKMDDGDSVG